MSLVLNVATAAFTLTALMLVILGVKGWLRSRRMKSGLLALAFVWFAVAGILATWWLFTRQDPEALLGYHIVFTTLGLLTIYFASVKR